MNPKNILIAYFSMEIGIKNSIPTYSGGLGILAGDTLRSMTDMEIPAVGITLLYKKGYFRQVLDNQGNQIEKPVIWNPNSELKKIDKIITIKIKNRTVYMQPWIYYIKGYTGHINPIIFIDTDLEQNNNYDKELTSYLYGKDNAYRLAQEIILGIGGIKILKELGFTNIEKYHMNEGHSALLTVELMNTLHNINEVRERCVFTTHTPVPAGHDQFDKALALELLEPYLNDELKKELFIDNKLNMTYVGLRFSKFINGVAKKHGEVSRTMFPGYHIESITNGVHSGFWTSKHFKKLFDMYIPQWQLDPFSLRYILGIPKENIWDAHLEAKKDLINFINTNYSKQFDTETFTIGFARRVATYKRNDLLFQDLNRLKEIASKFKGIQIVFAGKAHPHDQGGKDMIKRIIQSMNSLNNTIKTCYIEDYDIEKAKLLISGVDLWLNTPMRPQEASGTSGMKAAHNGVLQFSTLDGWWLEGHIENITGWSIGIHPNEEAESNHTKDIDDLYAKLEYVILPKFYNERDEWINMMQHAIALNGSFFNTTRMVQQYVLNAYFL